MALAENHNVREIPQITTGLFKALRDAHGFRYLALEQGAVAMEHSAGAAHGGRARAVWELGRRVPRAFHFWNDQELAMIAEVTRLSPASRNAVWGVDREYAATMVLEELIKVARNGAARAAAAAMRDSALAYDTLGHAASGKRWLADVVDSLEITGLRNRFRPESGSPADFLLRDLELARLSAALYRAHSDSTPTGFDSNRVREEWMVERFRDRYRERLAAGERLPKVLLKSGHWHIFRGYFQGNIPTLGNFVSELARSNGLESYHIWTSLINRPGVWWSLDEEPPYGPIGRVGDPNRWVLVDLRPLRPWAHAGRLKLSRELRQIVFTFDAALLIGGGSRATVDELSRDAR